MRKNEMLRQLFKDNACDLLRADTTTPVLKNGVCLDGVVDEDIFESGKYPQIMFLLKETNGHEKGKLPEVLPDWDYRGWLEYQQAYGIKSANPMYSHKFYGAAFNKLCMWTDLLCDCIAGKVIPYEEYRAELYNEKHFREVLKRVAIVNLKKTWGGASTEWKNLNSYLNQEGNDVPSKVLREELSIIDPQVVICGGRETFDFAKEIFQGQEQAIGLEDGKTLSYFKVRETLFVDFYHPSCRGALAGLYNYALKRFEALKTILCV